jgi:hypothetical protein
LGHDHAVCAHTAVTSDSTEPQGAALPICAPCAEVRRQTALALAEQAATVPPDGRPRRPARARTETVPVIPAHAALLGAGTESRNPA